MFGAFGFSYCFLYNVELFPSHVRGFTVAVMFVLANMGCAAIPYFGVLADRLGLHFLTCLLPFAVLGLLASCFLPETVDLMLQN